jgi:hypothetical protein
MGWVENTMQIQNVRYSNFWTLVSNHEGLHQQSVLSLIV